MFSEKFVIEYPHFKLQEIAKLTGIRWRAMTKDEKKVSTFSLLRISLAQISSHENTISFNVQLDVAL